MTNEQHPAYGLHVGLCDEARNLMVRKARDYSGNQDPLRNLNAAKSLGVNPLLAVLVRMQDKLCRLATMVRHGGKRAVTDESFEDTERDLINYTVLFEHMRRHPAVMDPEATADEVLGVLVEEVGEETIYEVLRMLPTGELI